VKLNSESLAFPFTPTPKENIFRFITFKANGNLLTGPLRGGTEETYIRGPGPIHNARKKCTYPGPISGPWGLGPILGDLALGGSEIDARTTTLCGFSSCETAKHTHTN